ncbi:MAG: ATP-binding protein, partial [Mariprofundaceae bacterium]|nr:ATP-binding protein [Mariprofundaceae bacterium]
RELLGNLLSNAFHYTRHGGVLLAARMRGDNVLVEVWDTGCGIAEGEQERIFDELVQLHTPERDRSKGIGLGLSIASRLAGMLDTRIHLSSRPGRGSVFAFELPLCMEEASAESVADSAPMKADFGGGCLFVIDDDPQVREGLAMLLKQWRCDVSCFADGDGALAGLKRAERIPEVILCDYRLPNQSNGVDVIRALRREAGTDIPALLLSGETDEATMQAASNADIPLLHKPVSARRLGMFLGRCLLDGE